VKRNSDEKIRQRDTDTHCWQKKEVESERKKGLKNTHHQKKKNIGRKKVKKEKRAAQSTGFPTEIFEFYCVEKRVSNSEEA